MVYIMISAILENSNKKNKKYKITLPNEKPIHFGAKGYDDYTTHKDTSRQLKYLARHYKNENWLNPLTAGFWAKWLLWSKPDMDTAIDDIEKIFGINIIKRI